MTAAPYRVLARKYRPITFAELIGQEAMVRTLSNAIRTGRIAQAFVLTGVRGIGKTTTARLIARALNCIGADGGGGPTVDPCGVCANCRAIAEDRHPDVIEMDAASRTGVDNIRDLIDGVRYLPVQARFKIYILDEVHMLSEKAFNALLKTLEEPPAHVKFVFCTTEIRKVPVTVLSRCQRFDLRRVEAGILMGHLGAIAARENTQVEPEALALIARAAEGSVRDGLSLLDQAIAHGAGEVRTESVRDMLGLADRTVVFDLLEQVFKGDMPAALASLRRQYDAGADPAIVLQDLLDLVHWLTCIKVLPQSAEDVTVAEAERARGRDLASRLTMPALARAWQMLLKGLSETRAAPQPAAAAEMVLVRLAYAADLPNPADLVRTLSAGDGSLPSPETRSPEPAGRETRLSGGNGNPGPGGGSAVSTAGRGVLAPSPGGSATQPQAAFRPVEAAPAAPAAVEIRDFDHVAALLGERKELALKGELFNHVHLVKFEPGRIEWRPQPKAPPSLASEVARRLTEWTGRRWVVAVSNAPGDPTLAEQAAARAADRKTEIENHPLVRAVLTAFPGARVESVRDAGADAPPSSDPGVDEEQNMGEEL